MNLRGAFRRSFPLKKKCRGRFIVVLTSKVEKLLIHTDKGEITRTFLTGVRPSDFWFGPSN
jgi:hypothetical protein